MTYSTVLVHLQVGAPNTVLLKASADFAELFRADVVGVSACQPAPIPYGDGYTSGTLIQECRDELEKETTDAETEFRSAFQGRAPHLTWRSSVDFAWPADYIAEQARTADLIITAPEQGGSMFDGSRQVSIADLVMSAGRPVLIVPPSVGTIDLGHIVVGWKDTREARRAISDALPLLKKAGHVTVVELASTGDLPAVRDRLADVIGWLGRHGITAEALAETPKEDDAARLGDITRDKGAGVLVAGAYGHSRVREWAFGGVTRSLLHNPGGCTLLSH
ncbi:universal stress protein [Bosea sp. 685]|uniref:universal stress protein n=1 Tax=Bosea sp. 685 TaxID=3080057 RepID=UPI0028936B09|nr:universal stress protein [Bosea sp. 685]WNJ93537.1 universal stress protein [Bosea sp. 685]